MTVPKWTPHSIEAEQALLGAILLNNEAYSLVSDFLRVEHFFEPLHAHIFEILGNLISAGKRADPITARMFIADGLVSEGMTVSQYLASLAANATTIINARDYATDIRDLALHRRMIEIGVELQRNVPIDVAQVAADAIDALDEVSSDQALQAHRGISMKQAVASAVEAAALAYQQEGQLLGMSTGLHDLDAKLLGLHAGDLVVLAGRPGMGKTAVMLSIARCLAEAGHPGQIFSMEMDAPPLAQRMIADKMYDTTPITYMVLRSGKFLEEAFERVREAGQKLSELPIDIQQQSGLTVSQIAAKARRHKRKHGLKWIAVDYLQLIKPTGRYQGNQTQEIGEITVALKALAKELQVPVILLSQLNRAVEARDDKRPNLSDLRQSGNIEQDADVVLMVYREAYYVERAAPKEQRADSEEFVSWSIRMQRVTNLLDIIIEKQRQGPIGTVRVHCNIGCNAIRDLITDQQLPEQMR